MARIDDGFSTTILFTAAPTALLIFEKTITPPGFENGGAIDTTTMLNTAYRTMAPKKLKTLTEMSFTAAYEPGAYTELLGILGVNDSIVITFPDSSTLTFYGWIDAVAPNELVEGEQGTLDITVIPSNVDTSGAETAPVLA
jgi:hypothetical protein